MGTWSELNRGASGDARATSQNNLVGEFLGDYVYAVATRTYGAAVWNDARNAADCPAIDAWRLSLRLGTSVPRPAPGTDCAVTFGNSDIFGGSYADPTPEPDYWKCGRQEILLPRSHEAAVLFENDVSA